MRGSSLKKKMKKRKAMSKGRILPKDFGYNLKWARHRRGLTQEDLGTAAGLSSTIIGCYETGKRQPTLNTFRMLCVTMNISADYLLGLSNETGIRKRKEGETDHG